MSNYAPDPKKERIYSDLATIPLNEVTAEQIETLTDPVTLSASNQDALITMDIVNKAVMRDGNPMPNTGGILSYTQSDANIPIEILPPKGEVWKIQGISIINSASPTGTNVYYTFLSDPTQTAAGATPSGAREVFYSSFSSSSTLLGTETVFEEVFQPLIITSEMYLRMYSNMANVAGGATVSYKVGYLRLR